MTKRALISVSDKAGIVEFAQELKKLGWDIISTGGTKVALDNAGVDTIAIDDVTGFPEMMDGRVKTLHPNIHGGLLARRDLDSHLQAAKDNQIELIDLVVVNLYPFKETILKPDVTYADAVENIDKMCIRDRIYTGKAKDIYTTEDEHVIKSVYKDQATMLNGARKETIKGKGVLNNQISSLIFEKLNAAGVATHFIKRISDTEQRCV